MRARINIVLGMFTGLLWYMGGPLLFYLWRLGNRWPRLFGWAWPMLHQPEWQKNTGLSLVFLPANLALLHFAVKGHMGNGLAIMLTLNLVSDSAGYGINRKLVWPKREVSTSSSGGRTATITVACFIYHKLLAILLMVVVGWNPLEVRMVLAGVGAVENPVLFKARDKWVFTPEGRHDAQVAQSQWETTRTAGVLNLMRMKIGL